MVHSLTISESGPVADICMTVDTGLFGRNPVLRAPCNRTNQAGMASDAIVLQVIEVHCCDVKRFLERLKRKFPGMPEAVLRLGKILRDEAGGCMAIVASCAGLVAGFLPGIKVVAHDMAIGA